MSIEVHDYHKSYGETVAVAGISFTVAPGEILGLVGPNGAGKTTTLRALAGILTPTRGRLLIDGHDLVARARRRQAGAGVRSRRPAPVREPDRLGAPPLRRRAPTGSPDWTARAEPLLEQFELVEKRDALASELSRGMRQKVAICCGYLHDPKAILLDEPLTGLDPRGIRTMQDSIRRRAESGTAFIVSSHLLSLVEDLCTHLLVLHRGRVVVLGSLGEIRRQIDASGRTETLEELFFRLIESPSTPAEPEPAIEPVPRS